jgi:Carboxypeptidase regulatory-like domain/TonB dependent receptor-like, beta-barrel
MKVRSILPALGVVLLVVSVCSAQFTLRGSISGIVTDTSHALVPGATVTLLDVDRNQTKEAYTNASGLYTFTELTIGHYQVSIEREGFRPIKSPLIALATGQSAQFDLTLEVGTVTQAVDVAATTPIVESGQSLVGTSVAQDMLTALPVKGRNFTDYALLAPNVYSFANSGTNGGVSYLAGGGGDNGMYINGVYSNTTWGGTTGVVYSPSVEALSEVKVSTLDFSASAGRDLSTFQAYIRGGTNQYHGTAYENFENSALNAWNPYTKMTTPPNTHKSVLQKSRYGGNLGGPIWIPHIVNGKDRLFFFVNYERLHQNSFGSLSTYRVPTAAEREGDFAGVLQRFNGSANYVLWNPFSTTLDANGNSTRTPVPNNDLRTIGINANAAKILGMLPMPNGYVNPSNPNSLSNFATLGATLTNRYQWDTRFDYRITNNDSVYVNHSRHNQQATNLGGIIPELAGGPANWTNMVTANYAKVLTAHLTNELIFGWSYYESHPSALAVVSYLRDPSTLRNEFFQNIGTGDDQGFGRIYFGSNWPSIGPPEVYINSQLTYQVADNVNYNRGAHSLQFGFNYLYENEHDWDFLRDVQFSSTMTRSGSLNTPARLGGDGMATFLLGIPTYMLQTFNYPPNQEPRMDFSSEYWGLYAQDKWQVTPKLTLNLGLRYDLCIPVYSPSNYGNVKMDFNYPGWQELTPGRYQGLPQHFVPPAKLNFAPRISLAYRIKPDFVARASYGIFYMAGSTVNGGNTVDYMMGSTPGYQGSEYYNAAAGINDDLPYYKFGDIFPAQLPSDLDSFPVTTAKGAGYFISPRSVIVNDENSGKVPYYQRYMVELQKSFGPNTVLSVHYVGGRGTDLIYYENVNVPAYRTGWTSTDLYDAARPSSRFGDVRLIRAGRNSFYNATTVQFDRRLSKGLQVTAHYTFSKTVQDYNVPQAGQFGEVYNDFGGYAEVVASWDWNGKIARGESPFSLPHRFVAGYSYDLPRTAAIPALLKPALLGWGISGMTTFQSGSALTVWNGLTSAYDMEPDVPNISGNPNLSRSERTFQRYFNASVYSAPPNNVKGTAGLGMVRGPGVNNWDLALSKTFHARERVRIQFRADLLNAFNHTQWSGVNTTYTNAPGNTFGWVTGARDPRFVQFLIRTTF